MKYRLLYWFPLISALFLLPFTTAAADTDSLYDAHRAERLSPELRARFGVRSGEILYDSRMIRAAKIAMRRAYPKTTWYCWRYVKDALLEAHVIPSRPRSAWAKQAGDELVRRFGFRKLDTMSPMKAPVGAVIVYGGEDAGHVEIRTASGFVSDFFSATPYPRPVIGIYVKPV
jgi:hypothetical protein